MNSGARAFTPSTDDCLRFTLTGLRRQGALRRHQMSRQRRQWQQYGDRVAEITITSDIDCLEPAPCLRITGWAFGRIIDQRLEIVARPQRLGGERFLVICPLSGGLCTTLILPPGRTAFASVRGWGVPYSSTRERDVARALRSIEKIETQLRGLSRYTRTAKRERLWARWKGAQDIVDQAMMGISEKY